MKKFYTLIISALYLTNLAAMKSISMDFKPMLETEPHVLRAIFTENVQKSDQLTKIPTFDYEKFRTALNSKSIDSTKQIFATLTPEEQKSELRCLIQCAVTADEIILDSDGKLDDISALRETITNCLKDHELCNLAVKDYFEGILKLLTDAQEQKITWKNFCKYWNDIIESIDTTLTIAQDPENVTISKNRFERYVIELFHRIEKHCIAELIKYAYPIYCKQLAAVIMKTYDTPMDQRTDFVNGLRRIMKYNTKGNGREIDFSDIIGDCIFDVCERKSQGHFIDLFNYPPIMRVMIMGKPNDYATKMVTTLIQNSEWSDDACFVSFGILIYKITKDGTSEKTNAERSKLLEHIRTRRPHLIDKFNKKDTPRELYKKIEAISSQYISYGADKIERPTPPDPIVIIITDINGLAAHDTSRSLALTKFKLTIQNGKYNADQIRRLFNEVKFEQFNQTALAQARSEIVDACKKCDLNDRELFAKLGTEPAPTRPMTAPKKPTAKKSSMNTSSKKSGGKKSKPKKTNGKKATTNENEKNKKLSPADALNPQDKENSVSMPTGGTMATKPTEISVTSTTPTRGLVEYRHQEATKIKQLGDMLATGDMKKVKKLLKQGVVPTKEMAYDIMQRNTALLPLLVEIVPTKLGQKLLRVARNNTLRQFLGAFATLHTPSSHSDREIQPIDIGARPLRSIHYDTISNIFNVNDKVRWPEVANLMRELGVGCKRDGNRFRFKFTDGECVGGHLHHNDEQDVFNKATLQALKNALSARGIGPLE